MDQDKNKNIDSIFEIDPDYESTNTAIRQVELRGEEDNKLTEEKLKTIIQEEFDKELQLRQKQLEEIEDKVFKAQKLLHVIRYVLISSYYNNKALEIEQSSSEKEYTNILVGQNRIHPAVKKLLGSNANSLKFLVGRTKRKASVTKSDSHHPDSQSESKKIKLSVEQPKPASVNSVKPESVADKTIEEPVTNRKKVQHRVVVGNISYFKKSLEQNNLTHKWMVYVKIFRGSKEGPEVTNLAVDKVVFCLHPSYKPHDVVDISQPPFHLSRRGWGEFPLRVKIYFKSSMNKPVDVIHQLKLDNTFTERQTLGNQTVVPIFLYDEWSQNTKQEPIGSYTDDNKLCTAKLNRNNFTSIGSIGSLSLSSNSFLNDQIISIEPVKIEPSTSYEHDYCYDNVSIKQEEFQIIDDYKIEEDSGVLNQAVPNEQLDTSLHDHAYSLPFYKEGQKSPKKHKSPVKQAYNELIYGLGPNYLDPLRSRPRSIRSKVSEKTNNSSSEKNTKPVVKVLKTVTGQSIRFLPESFNQVLLNNGSIVSVKFLKSPQSPTKSVQGKDIINAETKPSYSTSPNSVKSNHSPIKSVFRHAKQLLKLPKHTFKSMGEVLPYLFKRLPMWTPEANQIEYKCIYPFSACSEEEYLSWNIGKRLAAEWSRAKAIKRIVSEESYSKNWTTKAIFMYGRSHLYTPPTPSYRLFERESLEKNLILNCFQSNYLRNGCSPFSLESNDEAINITSPVKSVIDPVESNGIDTCVDISDKSLTLEYAFVKEAALDVGVILKPELLVTGVTMNAAERVILEAVRCFAENIIRRSRNFLICHQKYKDHTSEITGEEVRMALQERREFQSIQTFKENKMTMDFFS